MINIFQDSVGLSCAVGMNEVLVDPVNNMVLEGPLNDLMEEV